MPSIPDDMHAPAVQELIAQGADTAVTVSQQRSEQWSSDIVPCKDPPNRVRALWDNKTKFVCAAQIAVESVRNSLYGLLHLAVRSYHCMPVNALPVTLESGLLLCRTAHYTTETSFCSNSKPSCWKQIM